LVSTFAYNFNSRRYTKADEKAAASVLVKLWRENKASKVLIQPIQKLLNTTFNTFQTLVSFSNCFPLMV
jgi:hypothetical protein